MGTTAVTIVVDDDLHARLQLHAGHADPSRIAERIIDEGLRMAEFPGIAFRGDHGHRRAVLAGGGPDVWQVISMLADLADFGVDEITSVADVFGLDLERIRLARAYYARHPAGVDRDLAERPARIG